MTTMARGRGNGGVTKMVPLDIAQSCESCTHYDLVVIGAGPHSLAMVTRLMERFPSSLISENEHSRLHQLHSGKTHGPVQGAVSPLVLGSDISSKKILVIDKYGKWMERWNRSFEAFNISHLRSPLFFHMDPAHVDGLQAYAHSHQRHCELHDITHIVDKGCKKCHQNKKKATFRNFNQRDRELFYTPSSGLFADFCHDLVSRYHLHDMVVQGVCSSVDVTAEGTFRITYECAGQDDCKQSTTLYANAVVAAVGNTNIKNIPNFVKSIPCSYPQDRIAHSYDFADCLTAHKCNELDSHTSQDHKEIIPPSLMTKLKGSQPCQLVIVGGGLTSAQMVKMAIERGFHKVILILRSRLKVRQFDFSLDLMGRHSGAWFAKFWMEKDPHRRLSMLKNERNGGSITPEYASLLEDFAQKGVLTIHEKSEIESCDWCGSTQEDEGIWKVKVKNSKTIIDYECDQIWLGTGGVFDITKEPVFQTIAEKYDIETVNGLPILDVDLKLHPDLNFFVMSGYSALVMGPTAANLQGGRVGAERIASKLWDVWTEGNVKSNKEDKVRRRKKWTMADVAANMGNYYSALADIAA